MTERSKALGWPPKNQCRATCIGECPPSFKGANRTRSPDDTRKASATSGGTLTVSDVMQLIGRVVTLKSRNDRLVIITR